MSDELDLEIGDPQAADKIQAEGQAARGRRQTRRATGSKSKSSGRKPASEAEENSLKDKVRAMFSDFHEALRERDPELADVLERRGEAMSQGLVSVTRTIPFLRGPLVLLVNFFQPTLAFWELGSLLTARWIARRNRRAVEQREQANGQPDVTDVTRNGEGNHGYAG